MKTANQSRSTVRDALYAGSLLILAWGVSISSAVAADGPVPLTRTVDYGDLNLDSERGAKILYARLQEAAEDVCTPFEGRDLDRKARWQACFDQALTAAVARVNKSRVTALHNQETAHAGHI